MLDCWTPVPHSGEQRRYRSVHENDPVPPVIDDIGELLGKQADVQRMQDRTHGGYSQVSLEMLLMVPAERSHTISGAHTQPRKTICESPRSCCYLAECGLSIAIGLHRHHEAVAVDVLAMAENAAYEQWAFLHGALHGTSIATLIGMELEVALDFVRHNHRAVMATTRADGIPQLSPVIATVDTGGHVVVSTRETAVKTANLRRMPRVSLAVFTDNFFGPWVQVDGSVEIVSLPQAMDGLIEYYRNISGEHPDWDEYRQAMRSERRVLLVITVQRAGPDRSG